MKHWVSEEKVLEVEGGTEFLHKYFGPQEGDSGHRGGVERSGQPRWLGQSVKSGYKARPTKCGYSFSSSVGTQRCQRGTALQPRRLGGTFARCHLL